MTTKLNNGCAHDWLLGLALEETGYSAEGGAVGGGCSG